MRILTLILLSISLSVAGYSQAYEDKITYDKKKQACIAIDYSYSTQAVENAIVKKFRDMGYKVKEEKGLFNSDKGFLVFKDVLVGAITRDKLDYIFKIERKSKKETEAAQLYMILYKNDENAMERVEAAAIGRAKTFLNNMNPDIAEADLEIQISNQEENNAKLEKKLKTLQDEKVELDKKLEENAKNQDQTINLIETGKKDLEVMKGRRRK